MASVAIKVPSVGESISEGILARWLKPDGGSVQAGEPLFELETDKASSVVPAPGSGVLKIGVRRRRDRGDRGDHRRDRPQSARRLRRPLRRRRPHPRLRRSLPRASLPRPLRRLRPEQPQRTGGASTPLSPAVRRIVAEEGVDVASVPATGPGGRDHQGRLDRVP